MLQGKRLATFRDPSGRRLNTEFPWPCRLKLGTTHFFLVAKIFALKKKHGTPMKRCGFLLSDGFKKYDPPLFLLLFFGLNEWFWCVSWVSKHCHPVFVTWGVKKCLKPALGEPTLLKHHGYPQGPLQNPVQKNLAQFFAAMVGKI